ncbi:TadE family protein [Streptomyces noursei]|uniref:TadE family protein n=1 Tax=Streptomyces noursei TaxID=1971 RepID=UPI00081C7D0F|nr:TadE-like protein [Streptomyces noursei ATCC 11455]ANZ21935.1 TadE-like protein [Streptomyces noursei ATCC 11455]MCZ0996530.1 pilus assembly protein [Streptomyces noursei]
MRVRWRFGDDRGSQAVEAAIVTPLLVMLVCLAIAAGRLVLSGSHVDAAAADAAREASLARSVEAAQTGALAAARDTLGRQGVSCASTSVSVDTSGLNAPVGQPAAVTATVRCSVKLTDLLLPLPGAHTLTGTFTSVVDTYRERVAGS